MATKLTTVIVNQSKNGLIMKVGNHHHFAKLASVKFGGEFQVQVDLNWTYQEFLLEDTTDATKKVIVNSDDCCDYERITVTEVDGKLDVVRAPRHQESNVTTHAVAVVEKASRPLNIINSLLANSSWKIWVIAYISELNAAGAEPFPCTIQERQSIQGILEHNTVLPSIFRAYARCILTSCWS